MIAFRPVADGKRGGNIPNRVIDTALTRHPDGFGVAWREDGELKSAKFGPSDKAAFRQFLKRVDARQDIEYVAHFRFATHGPKAKSHSHPYEYTDPKEGRVLIFHNGVINIATTPAESDTEVFVRDVLARLESGWWRNPAQVWLVGESIGWSRLVLMTATETVNLQEADGEWDGGLWYSSDHRPTYYGSSTGYDYSGKGERSTDIRVYTDADVDRMLRNYAKSDGTSEDYEEMLNREGWRDYETNGLALLPSGARKWTHGGHPLTAVRDIPITNEDLEIEDAVICDLCNTSGDVWVIDGTVYFDLAHRPGTEVDVDEDTGAPIEDAQEAELHRSPEYRLVH